jgi:four helix bundle protein
MGENFELETQAIIASRVGLLKFNDFESLNKDLDEIQKMIIGLKSSIESKPY